jgi:hypothetical protein
VPSFEIRQTITLGKRPAQSITIREKTDPLARGRLAA